MVKQHKTWAGKFIEGRKDLRELREKDYLAFLKLFNKESKHFEPIPEHTKEKEEFKNET